MSICLDHVRFSYDRRSAAPLVCDLVLRVPDGSCLALLGQTGSGKSTVLKLMAGLVRPWAGQVRVDGQDAWLAPRGLRRTPRRDPDLYRRLGYVMQRPERQLFCATVAEDVAFGPRNLGFSAAQVRDAVDRALAYLQIEELAHRSPFELSGGQQRLAAVAGVLAMGPRNLVLDEPMASLDPAGRERMRGLLRQLAQDGVTCVLVTHELDDAASLADQVAVLDHGAVLRQGTPAQVFAQGAALEAVGLGVPQPTAFAQSLAERLAAAGDPEGAAALETPVALTLDALADRLAALAGSDPAGDKDDAS